MIISIIRHRKIGMVKKFKINTGSDSTMATEHSKTLNRRKGRESKKLIP
jgi:hypothetical protein